MKGLGGGTKQKWRGHPGSGGLGEERDIWKYRQMTGGGTDEKARRWTNRAHLMISLTRKRSSYLLILKMMDREQSSFEEV